MLNEENRSQLNATAKIIGGRIETQDGILDSIYSH